MKHTTTVTDPARALWMTGPGTAEIREERPCDATPEHVSVRTLFSGVSRGTESLVLQGRIPESERARMRCPHQAGEFPFPVKYGYASVGEVVRGPDALRGRAVFCLFPHQTAYVVPCDAVLALPPALPPGRAILAANVETALNALWDAEIRAGDRVTIIGAGVVGAACAFLMRRIPGVELELVDVIEARAALASAFDIDFSVPERARAERDVIIHASGTEAGLRRALELAAPDARIVELSWFGVNEVSLPLGRAFHRNRLTLRGSQVGTLSPNARPRFTTRARLELALRLCADPLLDCLIDSEGSFDALPGDIARVCAPGASGLCHRVRYATEAP